MNIEEQVLSREQMAHLKELGIDTSDASMVWNCCDNKWYLLINNELTQGITRVMKGTVSCFVPTYTIGDLIEKLPKKIEVYELLLDASINDVKYVEWIDGIPKIIEVSKYKNDSSLKDSLYEMLCWVAENHKELIK